MTNPLNKTNSIDGIINRGQEAQPYNLIGKVKDYFSSISPKKAFAKVAFYISLGLLLTSCGYKGKEKTVDVDLKNVLETYESVHGQGDASSGKVIYREGNRGRKKVKMKHEKTGGPIEININLNGYDKDDTTHFSNEEKNYKRGNMLRVP